MIQLTILKSFLPDEKKIYNNLEKRKFQTKIEFRNEVKESIKMSELKL